MTEPVLSVRDLVVEFLTRAGAVRAVNGVSFDLYAGDTLGIVGESGSGKTVTVTSLMGLLRTPPARIVGGTAHLDGVDLLTLTERELRHVRGKQLAMVFQDPMTSLNPVLTVGRQVSETLRAHDRSLTRADARSRSIEMLDRVGVANASRRYGEYPMHYSGGMRQRAMLAMALANQPKVLLADEPTTALDTTIQAQVLDLLRELSGRDNLALVLITHDLRLVAELADRVVVMYGGRLVEEGTVHEVFARPTHPYTVGLMRSLPSLNGDRSELEVMRGEPPDPFAIPRGCPFHPRCPVAEPACFVDAPVLEAVTPGSQHRVACPIVLAEPSR